MTESDNLSRFVAYLPFPHSLSGQYYISCPADSREETVSSNLTHTQLNPLQAQELLHRESPSTPCRTQCLRRV